MCVGRWLGQSVGPLVGWLAGWRVGWLASLSQPSAGQYLAYPFDCVSFGFHWLPLVTSKHVDFLQ